jgi:NADH-quinone oxidoreductase subunit A
MPNATRRLPLRGSLQPGQRGAAAAFEEAGLCGPSLAGEESWPHLDWCVRISSEISMPSQYIPILIFAALAAAFPAVTLVLFRFIRPTPAAVGAKLKPYECGVEAEGDTRGRYSVRFYIVAILFVIFDVETTFLFPWAVLFSTRNESFRLEPVYALASMFVFLGILIIGYVWLYRKGALEWV